MKQSTWIDAGPRGQKTTTDATIFRRGETLRIKDYELAMTRDKWLRLRALVDEILGELK